MRAIVLTINLTGDNRYNVFCHKLCASLTNLLKFRRRTFERTGRHKTIYIIGSCYCYLECSSMNKKRKEIEMCQLLSAQCDLKVESLILHKTFFLREKTLRDAMNFFFFFHEGQFLRLCVTLRVTFLKCE